MMKFYRYALDIYHEQPGLMLEEYHLRKETPKGYWIGKYIQEPGRYCDPSIWVSKEGKKRYAYPTKQEALHNFICRTRRRINILSNQLDNCKTVLRYAEGEKQDLYQELIKSAE